MTKIKLSLENLRVESFTTCAAEGGLGTVFGHAKTVDTCAGYTGCGPECETYYGNGACSADDGCNSAPHGITGPCNGCVETDYLCLIDGGVLEG